MIPIEKIKNYFTAHLLRELVSETPEPDVLAASAMAELDVQAHLGFAVPEDPCYLAAVCEQTVYLLTHKDQLADDRFLVSEKIEGLGSRSYAAPENLSLLRIAPRAKVFINSLLAGRQIRLERG